MPVTDDQLELLEAYLDGELPADQEEALCARLEAEMELKSALEGLRAERDVRAMVWSACEPDEKTVQRLVMRVEAAVDRQSVWAHRFAKWRIPSAVAACILLGFTFGWVGRGNNAAQLGDPGTALVVGNSGVAPAAPGLTNVAAPSGPVELPIVNEYGQQVGVQRFKSAEEAARFLEDLTRWQNKSQKVKDGNVTLTGEEKF